MRAVHELTLLKPDRSLVSAIPSSARRESGSPRDVRIIPDAELVGRAQQRCVGLGMASRGARGKEKTGANYLANRPSSESPVTVWGRNAGL